MEVYKYNANLNRKFTNLHHYSVGDKKIYANEDKTFWTNKFVIALIDTKTPDDFTNDELPFDYIFKDIEKYNHIVITPEYIEFTSDRAIVHFKGCEGLTPINSIYVYYFTTRFPNCEFRYQNEKKNAIGVFDNGFLVGAVMPMQQFQTYKVLEDAYNKTNENTATYNGCNVFIDDLGIDNHFHIIKNMAVYERDGFIIYDKTYLPEGEYRILKNKTVQFIRKIELCSKLELSEKWQDNVCLEYPVQTLLKAHSKSGKIRTEEEGKVEIQSGTIFNDTWGVCQFLDKGNKRKYQVVYTPTGLKVKTYEKKTTALAAAYRASKIIRGIEEDFWESYVPRFRPLFTEVQDFAMGFKVSDYFSGNFKLDNAILFQDLFEAN